MYTDAQIRQPSSAAVGQRPRILVVDDAEPNRDLLMRLLTKDGYEICTAKDGNEALHRIAHERVDLVVLDVMMPGVNGFEVCREVKRQSSTRLIPVVLITALQDSDSKVRGIDAGADDFITKPFHIHELRARVRSLLRLKRYTDDLDTAESVILSLALTIEARDASTEGHCQRLAAYATTLGASLGLGSDDLAALERGGFLHDIGKVGVPDNILLKPGRLTPDEYALVKQHTIIGDRLCGELRSLRRVRSIVRHHHERLDGSGYPDGLVGDAIPLLAQIIAIVDVFDALTTVRPYKAAMPVEAAYEELKRESERGWHRRDLVETFIANARQRRFDSPANLAPPIRQRA
jgi:putative two-component system response regulator